MHYAGSACTTAAFFLLWFLYDDRKETVAKRMQQCYS